MLECLTGCCSHVTTPELRTFYFPGAAGMSQRLKAENVSRGAVAMLQHQSEPEILHSELKS